MWSSPTCDHHRRRRAVEQGRDIQGAEPLVVVLWDFCLALSLPAPSPTACLPGKHDAVWRPSQCHGSRCVSWQRQRWRRPPLDAGHVRHIAIYMCMTSLGPLATALAALLAACRGALACVGFFTCIGNHVPPRLSVVQGGRRPRQASGEAATKVRVFCPSIVRDDGDADAHLCGFLRLGHVAQAISAAARLAGASPGSATRRQHPKQCQQ